MDGPRLKAYLLLLSGMSLVGVYVALSRPLTAAFPVFLLAWLRFGIAALALLPWTIPWLRAAPAAPRFADWRTLLPMSLFGNFLFSIFMLQGVAMTSAATAGVILATLPAVVALLGAALLRERLDGPQRIAVGLAVAGVAVLAAAGPAGGSAAPGATAGAASGAGAGSVTGALLVFACVCCEAVYVVLGRRLAGRVSPMRISAAINLVGLALMTPFGLAQALRFDFGSVPPATWALLAFYALAASVASTWLWLSGLRRVPASQAGVFTIAMPLAASLVGTAWLGEAFGAAQALALACAVGGIALIARSDSGTPRVAAARPPTGKS
jgi:drug/metabolite transporter (DMT)-like permease